MNHPQVPQPYAPQPYVQSIAKGTKTKRGASIGFACQIVAGTVIRADAR